MTETNRDKPVDNSGNVHLIEQAYKILRPFETVDGRIDAANQGLRPPNYAAAAALIDAGWRPPPTGDVIERWKQRFGDLQEEHRKTLESWDRQRDRLNRNAAEEQR